MSTQVRFADCRPDRWKAPRPYLVPSWFSGNGFADPSTSGRQPCIDNEPPRRRDRLPQKYGTGTPAVQSALTDLYGVHKDVKTDYILASTPEGSVKLPVNVQARQYMPTIDALDFLTHTSDTRLQAKPSRYYR